MALLDVNALVALAWDSHIHHARIREWFTANATLGWATCPLTEAGFVRVSTNPKVLPSAIGIADARRVLVALRAVGGHRFLADDVSLVDDDVPLIVGYRQVTDAHLPTLPAGAASAWSPSTPVSSPSPNNAPRRQWSC